MEISTDLMWLIAGAILVIFEFTVFPGVGFLFAGIGALITGTLISGGFLTDQIWQWISFFGFSVLSAILLWKPLMKHKFDPNQRAFSDLAGQKAILISDLEPGKEGKAKWSGTAMRARLEDGIELSFKEGKELEIVRTEGNVLILK